VASRLEQYLLSVIAEPGRPGQPASLLRGLLGGCAGLYDVGLEAYLAGETLGLRRREYLPIPVISIGNLTVGGTGKTPMTQWLCRRLQTEGKCVAVLSRGHGGEGQSVRLVSDSQGLVLLTASEAGDEPLLLAMTLPGVPVLVGKDRCQSGREAMRRFALDALVLDDGFQFWQLARSLDLVLLDAKRPFDNGFPLPRGLLREPMRHLSRAGIVVATRAGSLSEAERESLAARVGGLAPDAPLYFADHRAAGFVPADDLTAPLLPLDVLAGQPIFAVSAIAQPEAFRRTLEQEARAQVLCLQAWDDHHKFTPVQVQEVMQSAVTLGAEAVLMTEKDAVKWPFLNSPERLPTYALRIEMVIENEAGFLKDVGRVLKQSL